MIVWALSDSGNGSYVKGAAHFKEITIHPIGLDIEGKNNHFINLNLADYGYIFGDKTLWTTLDGLPKPDLIIASPPCESWSVASAMDRGNACWKQERGDSLFEPQTPLSKFTVRDFGDYEGRQFRMEKSFINRINGELTAFNLIQIIKRYEPKYYVIENPAGGRIWEYIEKVLGFELPYENLAYYSNYGFPIQKATKFNGNVKLNLKHEKIDGTINMKYATHGYNERSDIPEELVKSIFEQILVQHKQLI